MTGAEYRKQVAGECYSTSLIILRAISQLRPDMKNVRLCHGVCVLTATPFCEFGHAWIEFEGIAGGRYCLAHQFPDCPVFWTEFYRVGKIREKTVKRYTLTEAQKLLDETGIAGPWCPVIAAAAHAED